MKDNNLRFHPLVAEDLQEAFNWYEEQAAGLGGRFYSEVDARFGDIEIRPDIFGRAFEGLEFRFAKLKKFPYLIIFRINESRIDILGVFHSASNPEKWRRAVPRD